MSGTAPDLVRAKHDVVVARRRLSDTMGALRYRLKPATLASGAWGGVRDKGSELGHDAVEAVKDRPKTASVAVAAILLFLARDPIRSVAGKLLSRGKDDDLVTTRLDEADENYDLTAPVVAGPRMKEQVHDYQ